jgi:hypothetical protein
MRRASDVQERLLDLRVEAGRGGELMTRARLYS